MFNLYILIFDELIETQAERDGKLEIETSLMDFWSAEALIEYRAPEKKYLLIHTTWILEQAKYNLEGIFTLWLGRVYFFLPGSGFWPLFLARFGYI